MSHMISKGTGAERVQRRRDKLRNAGLRPLQIWVPDTRVAGFAEECIRQARLIAEAEAQEHSSADVWFDASDRSGWTA